MIEDQKVGPPFGTLPLSVKSILVLSSSVRATLGQFRLSASAGLVRLR